jgi:hypothetical protein
LLASDTLRFLRAEPQIVQDTTDMVGMVRNPELLADDLGHPSARPQLVGKPCGHGAAV